MMTTTDKQKLHQERFDLIRKTIALEPVERTPVIYMGSAFAPRYMGMSMAEYCADPEAALQVTLATMDRLDQFGGIDGANTPAGGRITAILSALWLSRLAVPGRDLPEDSLWQVKETEVMTEDDYDTILEVGWKPFLQSYMPRVIDPEEMAESFTWLGSNRERIQEAFIEHGYVVISNSRFSPVPPFESLCGGRSMQKFFLDLFRIPDKVEAVMAVIMEDVLADIEQSPAPAGIGGAWLGGWRGASGLISSRLWDRFVWPYIARIAHALVDKGVTPVLHFDQDWTRDLGRLRDLPARKCILNPDGMTDIRKFREETGDHMAMMGDVPATLLTLGNPAEIRQYVRDLIELFEGSGLLICPGCDAPIDAKPENMEAMVAAVHE